MFQDVIGIIHQFDMGPDIRLGDVADTMSSRWTVAVTVSLAVITTYRTYVLSPIQCNINNVLYSHKALDFGAYVNSYCFVKGTIARLDGDDDSSTHTDLSSTNTRLIEYYPWIPLYLGITALMPYFISTIWHLVWSRYTGGELRALLYASYRTRLHSGEERRKDIERISSCIADSLWIRRQMDNEKGVKLKCCVASCLNFGYITTKFAYLLSHVLSVVAMHSFLGFRNENYYFGFQFFGRIVRGNFSETSKTFPRLTWCRLPIKPKVFENFQCVLSGNLFSETTFAILWSWHVTLFFVMMISLLVCLCRIIKGQNGERFLRRGLTLCRSINLDNEEAKRKIELFSRHFVQRDGLFILCMIDKVVGPFVANEVTAALWERYERTHDCLSLPRPRGASEMCSILARNNALRESRGQILEPEHAEDVI